MTKYLLATPYAGIPLSCDSCTKDVLEHQVLQLVWHVRCRFDMRPFEHKSEKIVKRNDAKTCSICLSISQDAYARRKHEETVHEGFTCIKCGKSYTNRNALNYHEQTHNEIIKHDCALCELQFSSERNLVKHSEA